jgi:hypothetical protein
MKTILASTLHFWQRRKSTLAFFLLLLGLGGCKDLFTCKGNPVGPDPGSGQNAFPVAKIARWDGNAWHSLGKGVTSIDAGFATVNDIVIHENMVYVAGVFDFAGEYEVNSIARWNGNSWQGFGNLEFPGVHAGFPTNKGSVNAIAITGSGAGARMFVGGGFQTVYNDDDPEGLTASNLAYFEFGSSLWKTMDEGVNGEVNALASHTSILYVAGALQSANNLPNTNLIAQWDASSGTWAEVGAGLYGVAVHALVVNGNDLYVGGQFSLAGTLPVNNVARWDGTRWSALGSGLNGTVYDLTMWGNELYAAGQFFAASSEQFHSLARWRDGAWTLLGDPIAPGGQESYQIKGLALAAGGNHLYLGGRFDKMGGQSVYHVARWDRERWLDLTGGTHEIGETLLSGVRALGVLGTDIFAGGTFSSVGKL